MSDEALHAGVRQYYEGKLHEFGVSAKGVDWNTEESQEERFRQLVRVVDDPEATIIDYGCGYGALAGYLRRHGHRGAYTGYDLSPDMIAAAIDASGGDARRRFTASTPVEKADYTLASGIFNVKMHTGVAEWEAYMYRTLSGIASLSLRGFAFNALTSYSDENKRRDTLYYADPRVLFDHCKRTYSRAVSLLHDYPLYEFTVLVRL